MTKRSPVSTQKNIWIDGQQVDDTDLTLEQTYNDTIESSTINNHIGTGILPEVLVQNVLFESSLVSGYLDGKAIYTQRQPSDNNFGNQLEIILSNSKAAGHKTVKVAVIGLDFQSNLQFETFTFKTNETQVSKKHFTQILVLLFNDLFGDTNLSLNLGGQLLIKEVQPMSLSRSPIMVAQDQQPNLFFRDFFVEGNASLASLLQSALPLYNIDTLGIYTANTDQKLLLNGDVTTQIGEKFLATTNNIQKVSLLLSVRNLATPSDLTWNGDLIVSIYPLQSSIECASDISPSLPIDFSPYNVPVAQVSINYSTLQALGVELDSVPQPVDFVFSNSPIASGNVLIPGAYYAIALKRSGSANKCDIIIDVGTALVPNSRITTFTGSLWIDIPEEQLWFKVWTDAAKLSDGQAYESGHGIVIPKTSQDPITLTTVDYSKENLQFYGNDVFRAVVAATTEQSVPVPDQRTGNPVLTRQQFVPSVSLLNTIDITNLEAASEPLVIGAITDKNRKFFDSISSLINAKLHSATIVKDELLIRVITDPTDITTSPARYDGYDIALETNLLNGDFVGALITPNANNSTVVYRIAESKLCSYILGDVNGDGVIDSSDLDALNSYLNTDLTLGLPLHSSTTTVGPDGYFVNGYLTETQAFTNLFSASFQVVRSDGYILASAADGVLVAHPTDARLAQFASASVDLNATLALNASKLIIIAPGNDADWGGFDIVSSTVAGDILTIRKTILSGDVIGQMLRADVDGDFHITSNDGYLLQSYIDKLSLPTPPAAPYPAPTSNQYAKIGSTFNVLRFRLEKFIDRSDDYTINPLSRSTITHIAPDIFVADGYFDSHNYLTSPVPMLLQKQLTWDDSLIVVNSNPKLVPSVFTNLTGFTESSCTLSGIVDTVYAAAPAFDPGTVNVFVPNNLILGLGGELQRPDGYFYKVDFEVGTVVLEIPDGLTGLEKTVNLMDDFIIDYTGGGVTRLGFPAMRFADCSFVQSNALTKEQLRFSVSVQSFSPNTNGLTGDGYTGIIVDGKIGVSVDYATGLLTLNFTNLYEDPVMKTFNTKVQIQVFMKKAGFNNKPVVVNSTQVNNLWK